MDNNKTTFQLDLKIESYISVWLDKNFYSDNIFQYTLRTPEQYLQHKGVDIVQKSYEIYGDNKEHIVDEKTAIRYVKKEHSENSLGSFAFELEYLKDGILKDGWLFGEKYSLTEFYQVMWLWGNVPIIGKYKYDWKKITDQNITKIEGYILEKKKIQRYAECLGITKQNIKLLRKNLEKVPNHRIELDDGQASIILSDNIPEKPINLVIKNQKLNELALYHLCCDKVIEKKIPYSVLLIENDEEKLMQQIPCIVNHINNGTKCIVISRHAESVKQKLAKYIDVRLAATEAALLNLQNLENDYSGPYGEYINGDIPQEIIQASSFFNWTQYQIEHLGIQNNIAVQAGAGTGKTYTMIQRVLYLVLREGISIKDIALITFTNKASNEMKEKLTRILIARFKITHNSQYIQILEMVPKMTISTIDSFCKEIIQETGHLLGYGKNLKISSMKNERREIVEKIVDAKYREESNDYISEMEIKYYQYINFILELWDKILSRGIKIEAFKEFKVDSTDVLLKKIVTDCEVEIQNQKIQKGTIEMSDLKFLSEKLLNQTDRYSILNNTFKCLFVDEFQDTDNLQIDYVKLLHDIFGTVLFIVGDENQSIYRFRGAEQTAFKRISERITFREFKLDINYRTNKSLLEDMELVFSNFKNLSKTIRLRSSQERSEDNKKINFINFNNDNEFESVFIEHLGILKGELENKMDEKVYSQSLAILCRKNYQVDNISKLLDKGGYAGKYIASKSGDLFQSQSARDLAIFIKLLIYPQNKKIAFEALDTPYFYKNKSTIELLRGWDFSGSIIEPDDEIALEKLVAQLKFKPFLSVLREVMVGTFEEESFFFKNLKTRYLSNQLDGQEDFLSHSTNYLNVLNIILEKIGETFGGASYSLIEVSDWLDIQIATNHDEDTMITEKDGINIIVSTIHKSKGLEYDAVLIPYTNDKIYGKNVGFLLDPNNQKFVSSLNGDKKSSHYEVARREEARELLKDESRILYVAITRAKQALTILISEKTGKNSFAGIMGKGRDI